MSRVYNLDDYNIEDLPFVWRPRIVKNVTKKFRAMIAREKPALVLSPLLIPTDKHTIFPPGFHRAIQFPHRAIFDCAELVKSDPTEQGSWKNAILKMGDSSSSDDEEFDLLLHDTSLDNDGHKPLKLHPQIKHDVCLALVTLRYIEEKLGIPEDAMRFVSSPYRGGVWILSFYSNYEDLDERMREDEIEQVLALLGIPNEEFAGGL